MKIGKLWFFKHKTKD